MLRPILTSPVLAPHALCDFTTSRRNFMYSFKNAQHCNHHDIGTQYHCCHKRHCNARYFIACYMLSLGRSFPILFAGHFSGKIYSNKFECIYIDIICNVAILDHLFLRSKVALISFKILDLKTHEGTYIKFCFTSGSFYVMSLFD